jgi:hypothetical protein
MTRNRRYRLLLKTSILVVMILAVKLLVHVLGWEVLSVNPLFSGIVAANVFLMGFLLSGVLTDFKESERLPGELAASLEGLAQELRGIRVARPEARVVQCLNQMSGVASGLLAWFHKRQRTAVLLQQINDLTPHLSAMEQWTQATLVARLKQEQGNLRRIVIRIHTIRETSFVSSGYLLADMITILLCLGLVLVRIEPFWESLFFVGVISYVLIFLLMLIRDLDNPFGYYEKASGEDVSLKPLEDAVMRISAVVNDEQAAALVSAEQRAAPDAAGPRR